MPTNKEHIFPEKKNQKNQEARTEKKTPSWGELADSLLPLFGVEVKDSKKVPLSPKDLREILHNRSSSSISYYVKKWNSLHPQQQIHSPGRGGSKGTWDATHGTWKAFFSHMETLKGEKEQEEDKLCKQEALELAKNPLAALLLGGLLSCPHTDSENPAQGMIDRLAELQMLLRLRGLLESLKG